MMQATPRPWTIELSEFEQAWINDANGESIVGFGGDDLAFWQEVVRAVNRDHLFDELVEVLEAMTQNFKPFTSKPIGAPNSQARLEQESQIEAHAKATAILEKVK